MAVTSTGLQRLNEWIDNIKQFFTRKEKAPMFTTFVSLILVFATLLGGGITVVAAQSSQPSDWLYAVKTVSEDAFYQLTSSDQNHFNLSLIYADRRMAEIQNVFENGLVPPDAVTERLRTHLQTAFELSVKNMADAERLLEQIRLRLEEQLRTRLQQANPDPAGEVLRLQIRGMLQERIGWAKAGMEQFAMLRQQTQNQQQTQNGLPTQNQQQNQSGQQTQDPPQNQNGQQIQNQQQYAWSATSANQYGGTFGNGIGGWIAPWEVTPTPMAYQYQYQNQNGPGGQGK
jgi:hypothetical protein